MRIAMDRIMTGGVILVLLSGLAGCGGKKDTTQEAGRAEKVLNIVATTGQIGDLVAQVGGDRVQVQSLMGPGVDPHLYKASAGDVQRLSGAAIIFYNGLHLESKMSEVLERLNARQPTVAISEGIPEDRLISASGFSGVHDPHIWFDVQLWSLAVDRVRDALISNDPEGAALFRENASAYAAQLVELDGWARSRIQTIPQAQRVLITAHDAFGYLGRAYGLDVRGLQGISTATEAGTGDVQDLARFIAERKIPALFVESSVSPRAIEAVQAAVRSRNYEVNVGGELFSDAMGNAGTAEGTYLGMFRHNIDTIVRALTGVAPHGN